MIARIVEFATDDPTGAKVFNVPDLVISPGLVDTHVHINEPGRTEWEGFDTATRAAAAGGVTTLVDMPLNSIPATTTRRRRCSAKRAAARAQCHVDVGFWGGVVPGNAGELEALVDAGVRGFKCFLVPSGVDEFPAVDRGRSAPGAADPRAAQRAAAGARRGPDRCIARSAGRSDATRPTWRRGRPASEARGDPPDDSPRRGVQRARAHRARVVGGGASRRSPARRRLGADHRRDLPALPDVCRRARFRDGATEFKCAPPIRDAAHRDALWDGLASGALDLVATDHSPAPPALKTAAATSTRAWGGIASLELSLPATCTSLKAQLASSAVRATRS